MKAVFNWDAACHPADPASMQVLAAGPAPATLDQTGTNGGLINQHQTPPQPRHGQQQKHHNQKPLHSQGSEAKAAGPELHVLTEMLAHTAGNAGAILQRAERDAVHARFNGIPSAGPSRLNCRAVQVGCLHGPAASLSAF